MVRVGADISDLVSGLKQATSQISGFSKQAAAGFSAIGSVGKAVTAAGAGLALGLGAAVKTAANFDTAMRKAGAIAGANKAQFNDMRQAALDLGAKTSKSATEVANAMTDMAAKGFSAKQVIAAMPGVISAAEASGEDLALTADTVASALNGFGLKASDATHVADVLAMAANKTAAGVEDMQYAFKYSAPVARQLGISLEELASATGIMSNAGIKGEQAGTTLRGGLTQLLNPSEKTSKLMEKMGVKVTDANGKFVGLSGVIKNLNSSMRGMTDAQKVATLSQIVGTEAASGFLTLMQAGPAKIDAMTKSLENSTGASKKTAAEMQAGIGGALQNLEGAFETFSITIGAALIPAITFVAKALTTLTNWFNKLPESMQKTVAIGAAITAVFALLVGPLLILVAMVPSIVGGFAAIAGMLGITSGALLSTVGVISGVIVGAAALAAAAYNIIANWEPIAAFFEKMWARVTNAFKSVMPALSPVISIFNTVKNAVVSFASNLVGNVANAFQSLGATIKGALAGNMSDVTSVFAQLIPTIIGILVGGWPGVLISISKFLPQIANFLTANLPVILAAITNAFTQISAFITTYAPVIIQTLVNGINTGLPAILNAAVTIITALIQGITTALPTILMAGVMLLTMLINGIVSMLPTIITAATQIITLLTNTIVSLLPQLITMGITLITTLLNGLISALPQIITAGIQILTALINGLISVLPTLINAAMTLIVALANALISNLPKIISAGVQILLALINGIIKILPRLVATGIVLIVALVNVLIQNLPRIISAGVKLITALIRGIIQVLPQLIAAGIRLIVALVRAIISNLPQLLAAGVKLIAALVRGIASMIGAVGSAALRVGRSIISNLRNINLFSVGKNIISGLVRGIGSMAGAAISKAKSIAHSVTNTIKSALKIHSPSRVMAEIGKYIGQGLVKGMTGSTKNVQSAASKLSSLIKKAMSNKKATRGQRAALKSVQAYASSMEKRLLSIAKKRESVASKLKDAQKKLDDAIKARNDYKNQVKDSALDFASVTNIKAYTAKGIQTQLSNRLKALKTFQANIAKMKKKGVSKDIIKQIVDAGVEQGGKQASLLANANNKTIKSINATQKQINSVANNIGNSAAAMFYNSGVNAAKGLVKGLQSQSKALEKQASKLANAMVSTIKRKLKIHSPSRVMRDVIGKNVVAGAIVGIEQMRRAAVATADNMASWLTPDTPMVSMAYSIPNAGGQAAVANIAEMPERNTSTQTDGRIVQLLERIASQNPSLNIDGKEFAKVTYDHYSTIGGTKTNLSERWG